MLELELDVQRDGFALNVRLALARGPTALVGPNGSGKSTLLRAILGAVPVQRETDRARRTRLLDTGPGRVRADRGAASGLGPSGVRAVPRTSPCWRTSASGSRSDGAGPCRGGDGPAGARRPALAASGRALGRRATEGCPRPGTGDRAAGVAPGRAARRARCRHPGGDSRPSRRTLHRLAIPSLVVTHEMRDVLALGGPVTMIEAGHVRSTGTLDVFRASPPSEFARSLITRAVGGV